VGAIDGKNITEDGIYQIVSNGVSLLYSFIIIVFSYFVLKDFFDTEMSYQNFIIFDNDYVLWALGILMAYLFYDFIWRVFYKQTTPSFYISSVITGITIYIGMMTIYGKYVLLMTFLKQFPIPLLNIYKLMYLFNRFGLTKISIYIRNFTLMLIFITYLIFRVYLAYFVCSYENYIYYDNPLANIFFFLSVISYIASILWLMEIKSDAIAITIQCIEYAIDYHARFNRWRSGKDF